MQPESGMRAATDDELLPLRVDLERLRSERDLLRDLLAVPPAQLMHFMADAARGAARLRTLLGRRAREPVEYLRKVAQLRRLCTRLAALAGRTPLPSVARLYDQTAEALAMAGTTAMGDGLLPALALIEESFLTLSMISERTGITLAPRLRRRSAARLRARQATTTTGITPVAVGGAAAATAQSRLELALQQLAERLAGEQGKRIELELMGLADVPEGFYGSVYDILAQLLRNAIEHGIETPAQRSAAGKNPCGTLLIQFSVRGGQAEVIFQDDGQGLQASLILQAGIDCGLIDNDSLLAHDPRQASSLIFYPGISTAADRAGRGSGMGIVRDHVKRMGGRIQVATKRAQFTRIRIRLPLPAEPKAAGKSARA
jgi:signal transduction histidine kinase